MWGLNTKVMSIQKEKVQNKTLHHISVCISGRFSLASLHTCVRVRTRVPARTCPPARVRTGQNGAAWQRAHVEKYGRDFMRLTADYLDRQRSGRPVHEWDV